MAVRVITSIRTKPGAAEDFMHLWDRKRYDDVMGLPGCNQYEIFNSAIEPERVYVLENWESRGAFHSAWRIISVQVPVGLDLLAEPTDQPHSGYRTEIYWDAAPFVPTASTPDGGRLVINAHVRPGERDAFVQAWKAAFGDAAGAGNVDLLLGTRNHDNVAELGSWSDPSTLSAYLEARLAGNLPLHACLGSAEDRMSGDDGIELYSSPALYRWNGSEWVAEVSASRT